MITYRTPTALDIPVLVSHERAIFKIDPWSSGQFKEEIAGIGHNRFYLLAESDGQIVAWGGAMHIESADEVQVFTLAVIPEFRGRGIARTILEEIITWATSKGAKSMSLEARLNNDEAIGLYESEGFTTIAKRRNYYAPGVDAIVMKKELP